MISCLRPSNKSSRLTLPLGPSNSYFFSTAIHGIRRRSAANASRERVKAFSFTRSCWRAASHSCGDTSGGVFVGRCPFPTSLLLSLLVAILFLLCPQSEKITKRAETIRSKEFSELADAHRQNSSRGSGSGHHCCCACDAYWAHYVPPLNFFLLLSYANVSHATLEAVTSPHQYPVEPTLI